MTIFLNWKLYLLSMILCISFNYPRRASRVTFLIMRESRDNNQILHYYKKYRREEGVRVPMDMIKKWSYIPSSIMSNLSPMACLISISRNILGDSSRRPHYIVSYITSCNHVSPHSSAYHSKWWNIPLHNWLSPPIVVPPCTNWYLVWANILYTPLVNPLWCGSPPLIHPHEFE